MEQDVTKSKSMSLDSKIKLDNVASVVISENTPWFTTFGKKLCYV